MPNATKPPIMPREKLLNFGVESLQDDELLAIFLRTGIKNCPVMQLAKNVLNEFGSLRALISADEKRFCQVKGLGKTQFVQLQAATELTRRYLLQEMHVGESFTHAKHAQLYLQAELEHREREVFLVLFLDTNKNKEC